MLIAETSSNRIQKMQKGKPFSCAMILHVSPVSVEQTWSRGMAESLACVARGVCMHR